MEEVDDIRKKKVSAELEYRNSMPASSYQQQKLRVCEICSAYLGIHDNDRRLADHFGGKLHLGFIKIREKLDGLLVSFIKILSSIKDKWYMDKEWIKLGYIGLNPHEQALYVLLCENNNTEKQTFDSHCLSCLFIKRPNSVGLIMFLYLSRTLHGICQFRFFEFSSEIFFHNTSRSQNNKIRAILIFSLLIIVNQRFCSLLF